jgi:KamA family protein
MSITKVSQISDAFSLTKEEALWEEKNARLPLLITDYYFSLINPSDPSDPIRRQVVPTILENEVGGDCIDPLEEVKNSVSPFLIHRYTNRCALLTTDRCFTYCRHCFRRRFTGKNSGPVPYEELERIASYLEAHKEVKEVLLTGGDMFTLSDEHLERMFAILKEKRPDILYRLCTRAVVTNPARFDEKVMAIVKKYSSIGTPFVLMTQFNHPRELTPEAIKATDAFIDSGIPAFNQSVLLKGVNDDANVLEELSNKLLSHRIKPYYLFQGDKVEGTKHLRCPLSKGLEIEEELRLRLSGLAMPQYTIDLPEGGGKVVLTKNRVHGLKDGVWEIEAPEGGLRHYPD